MGHGIIDQWNGFGAGANIYSEFSYSDLNSNHDDILPLVIGGACLTGAFQFTWPTSYEDCMAEEFLCSSDVRGAIGYIGSSVASNAQTFHIISNYYNATLNNYSYMLGEAMMESKLNYWSDAYLYDYNLIGDPALNIFYENAASYPDLCIKDYHITYSPFPTNSGETITINAYIRNNTNSSITDPFLVNCYAKNVFTQQVQNIGIVEVPGMSDNYTNVAFNWNTAGLTSEENDFDIYIEIDVGNSITEVFEDNNSNFNNLKLYSYKTNYPLTFFPSANSNPICFNFIPVYSGDELAFGGNLYTQNGFELISNVNATIGTTAIGSLYHDSKFQYVTIEESQGTRNVIVQEPITSSTKWSQALLTGSTDQTGPFITDLDHDGFEEIIIAERIGASHKMECFNYNGTSRWNYSFTEKPYLTFAFCNLDNEFEHIINIGSSGTVYSLKENLSNNGLISETLYQVNNFSGLYSDIVVSDIDKNGDIDLVFIFKKNNDNFYLGKLNLLNLSYWEIELINVNGVSGPTISDINNDGYQEIIVSDLTN
ncbi:MAG: C25 family cysteine peptidase, partial [Bacteroidales bacterium]